MNCGSTETFLYSIVGFCLLIDLLFFFVVVGVDLGEAWSLKCRGIVYGVIGKIQFFPGKNAGTLMVCV